MHWGLDVTNLPRPSKPHALPNLLSLFTPSSTGSWNLPLDLASAASVRYGGSRAPSRIPDL
eukprot:385338-Pyramimonas_sp.AAC.1